MATITAQILLDEIRYTSSDISLVKTERHIDNAIDYINLETGLSIANMSGSAGNKSVTVTSAQAPVIKALASLHVHDYVKGDPSAFNEGDKEGPSEAHLEMLRKIAKRGIMMLSNTPVSRKLKGIPSF